MYVEKDLQGKIIIQDISPEEAEILADCFRFYQSFHPYKTPNTQKTVNKKKNENKKMY